MKPPGYANFYKIIVLLIILPKSVDSAADVLEFSQVPKAP